MKMWRQASLGIVLVILSVQQPASATSVVSEGTPVSCASDDFVFDQDLVLAPRTEGRVVTGLYKATDEGWHLLPAPGFYEMKAASDGTIYIYAGDFKLYRSEDGGETWDLMGENAPVTGVGTHIFPSPVPDMVFLGIGDLPFTPGVRGVYRSTDGGATWEMVLEGGNGTWVAFSPNFANDGTAFAALDEYRTSLGIWKTEDWGETWTWMSSGLAYGFTFLGHQWVAVSPQYPQDQTAFTADFTGIYKTTNGGQSWFRLTDYYMHRMALSPDYINDQTILAADGQRLILSQDGGQSWQLIFEYYSEVAGIRLVGPFGGVPAPPLPGPRRVYLPFVSRAGSAGLEFWLVRGRYTGDGVECYLYRSYDLGATWEEVTVFEPSHWLYLPLVAVEQPGW